MRLSSRSGAEFELTIQGYQFPELASVPYDSNWLLIRVHVVHPRGAWTAIDPSLLTYEAAELADWLSSAARGAVTDSQLSFLEPNLWFELRDREEGNPALRVYFDLETRPAWAPVDCAGNDDLYVEFPLAEIDLDAAALALRAQLAQYPTRTSV